MWLTATSRVFNVCFNALFCQRICFSCSNNVSLNNLIFKAVDYLNVLAFAVQIVIETINNSKSKNDVNSRLSLLKQNGKFYHFWHYFLSFYLEICWLSETEGQRRWEREREICSKLEFYGYYSSPCMVTNLRCRLSTNFAGLNINFVSFTTCVIMGLEPMQMTH